MIAWLRADAKPQPRLVMAILWWTLALNGVRFVFDTVAWLS